MQQEYTDVQSKRRYPVPWSDGRVVMAAHQIEIDKRWGKPVPVARSTCERALRKDQVGEGALD